MDSFMIWCLIESEWVQRCLIGEGFNMELTAAGSVNELMRLRDLKKRETEREWKREGNRRWERWLLLYGQNVVVCG
jgi:hypothetical protein